MKTLTSWYVRPRDRMIGDEEIHLRADIEWHSNKGCGVAVSSCTLQQLRECTQADRFCFIVQWKSLLPRIDNESILLVEVCTRKMESLLHGRRGSAIDFDSPQFSGWESKD